MNNSLPPAFQCWCGSTLSSTDGLGTLSPCGHCGSVFFVVAPKGDQPGVVVLNEWGGVAGHSGQFVCAECGEPRQRKGDDADAD